MKARPFLALPLLVLALAAVQPAQPARAEVLTWADCVRETTANNPDLTASSDELRSAVLQQRISHSDYFPSVDLGATYGIADSSVGGVTNDSFYGTSLSLRQNLFSGFRTRSEVRRAKADVELSNANYLATKADVSLELKSAFAETLFAQEQLTLARKIVERRKQNVRLVQLRYDAGREHQGSLLRSQSSLKEAEFEVAQATRVLVVAQRRLARVMGRRGPADFTVSGDFSVTAPAEKPDFQALAPLTPDYQRSAAFARSTQADVSIARSDFYPSIDALASYNFLGVESNSQRASNFWSTSLALSLPLFVGGENYYNIQDAKVRSHQAEELLRSTDNQAAFSLEQSFAFFQDSLENVAVQKELVRTAEVRAKISQNLYTNGLLSFDDWDVIESSLITSEKDRLRSQRDAVLAEALWEQSQGKGVIP